MTYVADRDKGFNLKLSSFKDKNRKVEKTRFRKVLEETVGDQLKQFRRPGCLSQRLRKKNVLAKNFGQESF